MKLMLMTVLCCHATMVGVLMASTASHATVQDLVTMVTGVTLILMNVRHFHVSGMEHVRTLLAHTSVNAQQVTKIRTVKLKSMNVRIYPARMEVC